MLYYSSPETKKKANMMPMVGRYTYPGFDIRMLRYTIWGFSAGLNPKFLMCMQEDYNVIHENITNSSFFPHPTLFSRQMYATNIQLFWTGRCAYVRSLFCSGSIRQFNIQEIACFDFSEFELCVWIIQKLMRMFCSINMVEMFNMLSSLLHKFKASVSTQH